MPPPDVPPGEVLLLGDPVAHSLSPAFQNAAFRAAGMDARYVPRRVQADRLATAVAEMRMDRRILGANVTVPHKLTVAAHLEQLAGDAAVLRAVNTISRDGDRLTGWNTDRMGFARSLDDAGYRTGRAALVLGAGGAARAVVSVLAERTPLVLIAGRDPSRLRELCDLMAVPAARPLPFDHVDRVLDQVDLIVNATPIGLDARSLPLDPRGLSADHLVVDLVYNPALTPLLQAVRAAGGRGVNGLGMLLYQGAAAFQIWTGRPAPIAVMRTALEEAAGAAIEGTAPQPPI